MSWFSAVLLTAILLAGCGRSIMIPTTAKPQLAEGKALVTFIRATSFGGAIDFGLWDGENLVGVLDPKTYIQVEVDPGEHYFLARAENWSIVKANLEAGKRYYVLANVAMGVWKARVVLRPIRQGDADYKQENIDAWLTDLRPMMPDPGQAPAYVQRRVEEVRKALENAKSGQAETLPLEAGDSFN